MSPCVHCNCMPSTGVPFNIMTQKGDQFLSSCTPDDRHFESRLYLRLEYVSLFFSSFLTSEYFQCQWSGVKWPSIYWFRIIIKKKAYTKKNHCSIMYNFFYASANFSMSAILQICLATDVVACVQTPSAMLEVLPSLV